MASCSARVQPETAGGTVLPAGGRPEGMSSWHLSRASTAPCLNEDTDMTPNAQPPCIY